MLRLHKHSSSNQESSDLVEPSSGKKARVSRAHTPTSSSDDETEPLSPRAGHYSDKFIKIDPETKTLTLNHYLVLKSTRQVHIPDILHITPASELHWIGIKKKGLSVTGIFWAQDWCRGLITSKRKNSYVIKVKGDTFRVGFSVERPRKFMKVLGYLHPDIMPRRAEDTDPDL